MKALLLPLFFLLSSALHAQYYYNDIVGTEETNQQMALYKAIKVRTVSATGFDRNGVKATDFSEYRETKENWKALRVSTINNFNKTVIYSRFDEKSRVISMTDSSSDIVSTTTYQYDDNGRVSKVQNSIDLKDSSADLSQVETHQYYYNAAGKLEKMWRIIRNDSLFDSLEVRFVTDEDGNTGEERTFKNGKETSYLYYYYDDKHHLTDIVRFNTKFKKLMPDIMFEYDDKDRVIQKLTTTSSFHLGYLIWRYIFDEKGLKTTEALFNSDKELTGKIKYSYTFG
jgi:hypothetical protein